MLGHKGKVTLPAGEHRVPRGAIGRQGQLAPARDAERGAFVPVGEGFVVVKGGVAGERDRVADDGAHHVAVAVDLHVGVGCIEGGLEGAVARDVHGLAAGTGAGADEAAARGPVVGVGESFAGDLDVGLRVERQA